MDGCGERTVVSERRDSGGSESSYRSSGRMGLARALCRWAPPIVAGRLSRRIYPYEQGKRDAREFTLRARTGSPFSGNTADFHAHPVATTGYGEWRNWAIALALCRPGDVVVEVGANVGSETIGYSDIVGGGGRVVAFEPLPSNRAGLERLIPTLRHRNITLLPYAISDRNKTTSFAVPPSSMSQGIGHLLGAEEQRTGSTIYGYEEVAMELIDVECHTLDELADEVRGMRLLLADVEGAEVALLRGGREALAASRPALVLEASNPHLRRAGLSGVEELHGELLDLRYRSYEIGRLGLNEIDPGAAGSRYSHNWLCVPGDQTELRVRVERSLRHCGLMPFLFGLNPMARVANEAT
jgi:FkbM family methyltransferase